MSAKGWKRIPGGKSNAKCRSCVYGVAFPLCGENCKFSEIEGHCRTVKNGKSGYNPPESCEYYSRITKNNPRRRAEPDEFRIN